MTNFESHHKLCLKHMTQNQSLHSPSISFIYFLYKYIKNIIIVSKYFKNFFKLFIYLKLFYIFNIKFNFNKNLMVSMIYFKIILLFNFKHYWFFFFFDLHVFILINLYNVWTTNGYLLFSLLMYIFILCRKHFCTLRKRKKRFCYKYVWRL